MAYIVDPTSITKYGAKYLRYADQNIRISNKSLHELTVPFKQLGVVPFQYPFSLQCKY